MRKHNNLFILVVAIIAISAVGLLAFLQTQQKANTFTPRTVVREEELPCDGATHGFGNEVPKFTVHYYFQLPSNCTKKFMYISAVKPIWTTLFYPQEFWVREEISISFQEMEEWPIFEVKVEEGDDLLIYFR